MNFKYTDINLETATPEQIRVEIDRMKSLANEFKNEEQAIKIFLNSVYGALGNKWLVCFNPDVAEAVTFQGQNLIKHAEKVLNLYFHEKWHLDKELHEKLGITGNVMPVRGNVTIYADTDSNYVCFDEVLKSCRWEGDPKQFIIKLNEYRLTEFLKKAFEIFAERTGTVNCQDFEMENIASSGIWLAKKKYLLDLVWQDGIHIEPTTNITFKGVELVQSSTPQFAREKLKELMKFIFTAKGGLKINDIIAKLRVYKEEFRVADPDKISMGRGITDYQSYILNDTTKFEVAKGTPIHVRAAGIYNFMLNQNVKFKSKYEMIKAADKIKFYHVKTKHVAEQDVFGFLPNSFPVEFAPPIDYDLQFAKTIVDPLNRVTTAMGFPEIGGNLYVGHALF